MEASSLLVQQRDVDVSSSLLGRRRRSEGLWRSVVASVALVLGLVMVVVVTSSQVPTEETVLARDETAVVGRLREACANNDDDERFDDFCPAHDYRSWCEHPTVNASGLRRVCPQACEAETTAWSMVCVWDAVSHLDDVCAGTFRPRGPTSAENLPFDANAPLFAPCVTLLPRRPTAPAGPATTATASIPATHTPSVSAASNPTGPKPTAKP